MKLGDVWHFCYDKFEETPNEKVVNMFIFAIMTKDVTFQIFQRLYYSISIPVGLMIRKSNKNRVSKDFQILNLLSQKLDAENTNQLRKMTSTVQLNGISFMGMALCAL